MATKKTEANTEAKKTVKRTTPKKAAEKKTAAKTSTKKVEEKKPEIIDVEDFREVTEETVEAKVDPAEVINPPEDTPEVGFNVSEVVKDLMNKYKVDVNDQGGIDALNNIMNTTITDLHEKAGMDEKTSQIIATHAMETILAGINDTFKAERRIKAKADRLKAKEDKLQKKIQLTREERQNILYGSAPFGAPGIYTIASNLPNQIQVQMGGDQ
jgi:hypothetical protein